MKFHYRHLNSTSGTPSIFEPNKMFLIVNKGIPNAMYLPIPTISQAVNIRAPKNAQSYKSI